MGDVIRSVKDTLLKIQQVINPTIQDVFTRGAPILKDIQTQDQLFDKGIKSTGISITPEYADSTKKIKIGLNQPTDRVTLNDTGDYYRSINIDAQTDRLIISTNIEYAKFLSIKYGSDVLGLTRENLTALLNQLILPELDKNIDTIIRDNQL